MKNCKRCMTGINAYMNKQNITIEVQTKKLWKLIINVINRRNTENITLFDSCYISFSNWIYNGYKQTQRYWIDQWNLILL